MNVLILLVAMSAIVWMDSKVMAQFNVLILTNALDRLTNAIIMHIALIALAPMTRVLKNKKAQFPYEDAILDCTVSDLITEPLL